MTDECRGSGGGGMLLSFLFGAVIGGGIALLMTPRSGQETRDQIREAGDEARERLHGLLKEAEVRLREPLDDIQQILQDKKEVFWAAVEAGKQAAKEQAGKQQETT